MRDEAGKHAISSRMFILSEEVRATVLITQASQAAE
jgi:hypothetical protein